MENISFPLKLSFIPDPGTFAADQEADRLEKLRPALDSAGYDLAYAAGPRKKHGCVIAFKKEVYEKVDERTVLYDDAFVRPETNSEGLTEQARRGASFRTRNIGLLVALRRVGVGADNNDNNEASVVVATTHLFWHPKYTYERARQALILTRSVCEFRNQAGLRQAPAFVAGGSSLISERTDHDTEWLCRLQLQSFRRCVFTPRWRFADRRARKRHPYISCRARQP